MFPDSSTETNAIEREFDPPVAIEAKGRPLDPLFDFLHATLDRLQDLSEFLIGCIRVFVKSWIVQFTSGTIVGLLFISFLARLIQLLVALYNGTSEP